MPQTAEVHSGHPVLQELAPSQHKAFVEGLTTQAELRVLLLQLLDQPGQMAYIEHYSESWRNFQGYFADLKKLVDEQRRWKLTMNPQKRRLEIRFDGGETQRPIQANDIAFLYNRLAFMQDYPVDWPEEEDFEY